MSDNGKSTLGQQVSAPLWVMPITCIATVFYYQAIRDILISRNLVEDILPIIIAIVAAPLASIILVYIIKPLPSVVVGTLSVAAGRILLLSTGMFLYYNGEILIISGYALLIVGLLALMKGTGLPENFRISGAMLAAVGVLCGTAIQILMRQMEATYSIPIIIVLCAIGVVPLFLAARGVPSGGAGDEGAPAGDVSGIKTFSLLLIGICYYFLFMFLGKPEFLASRCGLPYRQVILGVVAGIAVACVVAVQWESARSGSRKKQSVILLFGNVIAALYLFFLYNIPEGSWQIVPVALCAVVIGLDLYRLVTYAVYQRSGWLIPAAGFAMLLVPFLTFALDGILLENHLPHFHGYLMLPLVAFSLLTAGAHFPLGKGEEPLFAGPAGRVSILPLVGLILYFGMTSFNAEPRPETEPLVFASLYTWYATPDGVLGRSYGGFEKEGNSDGFTIESPGMNSMNLGFNDDGHYFASGVSDGRDMDRFEIGFDFPAKMLHSSTPTFLSVSYEVNLPSAELNLEIMDGENIYRAKLPNYARMKEIRFEWPKDFRKSKADNVLPEEQSHLKISFRGPEEEFYIVYIDYVRFSIWRHWNEDYHAYQDAETGIWYNDPPKTLAAANRVTYTGEPWKEIEPFSPDGYYDSLDTNVMRSQLQLMEKAGIDVVLFMHPPWPGVIRKGMELIRQERLDLEVSWYWTGSDESELIREMETMGDDTLWAKIEGRPIVVVGPTGMRGRPQARYREEFINIARAGIFAVGDSYSPPKEEMLGAMAGHYYYDTTGLYRAMWGGSDIDVAKPDGTFVTGHGHLYTIFDAIARITHAHGDIFLATVIPGFDNLSVHGFERTPLYDGRPGTVVKRHDGATYAESWQAAIDAGADWICIVSWNELHEGSEIEPTMEDGVKYIELTREWSDKFHALKEKE